MSFMPSPGSIVRLNDGCIAFVCRIGPNADDDRVIILDGYVDKVTADDIAEVMYEVEPPASAEPMIGRIQARLHDGPLWRLGNLLSTARFRAWQLRSGSRQ